MKLFDYVVIGGGIVGLSTARSLQELKPHARIAVIEKEVRCSLHQTGRNSGVVHSGIYYTKGSLKAQMCREGNRSVIEFCRRHDIAHDVCGKVVVASNRSELPLLERLWERGNANELDVRKLCREEVLEYEPHVECCGGLFVRSTGIVNYSAVCDALQRLIRSNDGEFFLGTEVLGASEGGSDRIIVLKTSTGDIGARRVINCGGLHSDRISSISGEKPAARIVPFRGEYYEVKPDRRYLVKNLIYPVPNPDFPFLGVHFTRMIDGSVHAGPNAVLSFKREGYHRTSFQLKDALGTLLFPGFWKLAFKHTRMGFDEMRRSFSKRLFVESLRRLVPEICEDDLIPCKAGVRAQALKSDGSLVDDFLIQRNNRWTHVCNAPSPAATAAFPIGRYVAGQVLE